ncbi:MAG: class I SAM-dependent methyltransferase, partial [Bacillati bacterium]
KEIRDLNLPAEWILHRQDSAEGGKVFFNESGGRKVDLLYLDSDHTYKHVMNELESWQSTLADKCIIFTDDTWHENEPHRAINLRNPGQYPTDVYWAFHDFAEKYDIWKEVNFSYPLGKSFLFRGYSLK